MLVVEHIVWRDESDQRIAFIFGDMNLYMYGMFHDIMEVLHTFVICLRQLIFLAKEKSLQTGTYQEREREREGTDNVNNMGQAQH